MVHMSQLWLSEKSHQSWEVGSLSQMYQVCAQWDWENQVTFLSLSCVSPRSKKGWAPSCCGSSWEGSARPPKYSAGQSRNPCHFTEKWVLCVSTSQTQTEWGSMTTVSLGCWCVTKVPAPQNFSAHLKKKNSSFFNYAPPATIFTTRNQIREPTHSCGAESPSTQKPLIFWTLVRVLYMLKKMNQFSTQRIKNIVQKCPRVRSQT